MESAIPIGFCAIPSKKSANPFSKRKNIQISANRQNNSAKPKQKSAIPIDFGAIPSKKSANPFSKRKNIPDKRK
ncbi:hypothetical protein, partial [Cytobacillus oceanisediminis]|uniref:hypothetical protein n=1 Tax=Cytobacillus oceanisediminis TaxID=665099 RepID=UPI0025513329